MIVRRWLRCNGCGHLLAFLRGFQEERMRIELNNCSAHEQMIQSFAEVSNVRIAIGCDDAAVQLKEELKAHLLSKRIDVVDFGVGPGEVVDYPDVAHEVATRVSRGEFERAVLVCGTGIGMAIVANKVPGVRAAVCHDAYSAERARKSNNVQVICFGARVIGAELAKTLLDIWLGSEFQGGQSARKVAKIEAIDERYRSVRQEETA